MFANPRSAPIPQTVLPVKFRLSSARTIKVAPFSSASPTSRHAHRRRIVDRTQNQLLTEWMPTVAPSTSANRSFVATRLRAHLDSPPSSQAMTMPGARFGDAGRMTIHAPIRPTAGRISSSCKPEWMPMAARPSSASRRFAVIRLLAHQARFPSSSLSMPMAVSSSYAAPTARRANPVRPVLREPSPLSLEWTIVGARPLVVSLMVGEEAAAAVAGVGAAVVVVLDRQGHRQIVIPHRSPSRT